MVDLSLELFGVTFQNPVWVASGTFSYGQVYQALYDPDRLGAVVTKTLTPEPRAGSPPPRLWETPQGMLNSIGLNNVGMESFLEECLPWLQEHCRRCRIIVNVAGRTPEEFAAQAAALEGPGHEDRGIDAIEVNISCPNVDRGGAEIAGAPDLTAEVVSSVREATTLPLIVKLSPNANDLVTIGRAAVEAGADALSLINTLFGMAIDIKSRRPQIGTGGAGLSGPAIRPVGVYWTWRVAQALDVPVIGIGGIGRAEDAMEYFLAGAQAVQVGTANFYNPLAPLEIIEGLERVAEEAGVERFQELVGDIRSAPPEGMLSGG